MTALTARPAGGSAAVSQIKSDHELPEHRSSLSSSPSLREALSLDPQADVPNAAVNKLAQPDQLDSRLQGACSGLSSIPPPLTAAQTRKLQPRQEPENDNVNIAAWIPSQEQPGSHPAALSATTPTTPALAPATPPLKVGVHFVGWQGYHNILAVAYSKRPP